MESEVDERWGLTETGRVKSVRRRNAALDITASGNFSYFPSVR